MSDLFLLLVAQAVYLWTLIWFHGLDRPSINVLLSRTGSMPMPALVLCMSCPTALPYVDLAGNTGVYTM